MRILKFGKVDSSNWVTFGFWAILTAGIALRVYQFLMGASLWEDEAHLALSFIRRSYTGLLQPLDYAQSAPVLFLFSVETFTKIFGWGEKALRAFPFLVSIFTLPLFYFLLVDLTKSKLSALIGFFLFSVNLALIYFVNELKPYTVDVSVFIILGFITFTSYPAIAKSRNKWLAVSGCLAILYSNIAVIVLFCIAASFVRDWFLAKRADWRLAAVMLLWGVVFGLNYYFFIYQYPYAEEVRATWSFAYCPTDILSCEFVNFIKTTIETTFFTLLLYVSEIKGAGWLLLVVFIAGVRHAYLSRNYRLLIFLCCPVLVHLVVSALHLYPFYYRFILYLVPAFIILMAVGIRVITLFLIQKTHRISGILFISGTIWLFIEPSLKLYPLWDREVKPSLDFINKNYPYAHVLITTPHSLYTYYHETGYARNGNYRFLEWNLTPEKFYQLVMEEQNNFVLLHSADTLVDGYGQVMRDLRSKNLVTREFTYKTYTVSEIKQKSGRVFTYKDFSPESVFELNGEKVAANWGNTVSSVPWQIPSGKYDMAVLSKGTPAFAVYPHLHVIANGKELGVYYTTTEYSVQHFTLEIGEEKTLLLQFSMDNDTVNTVANEDRNAFIRSIVLTSKGNK
ncbi:MAG: hypothetical protein K1X81_04160 [Bacteroidia bacterium]|nr:hypothetical protein [Bacteroidia bacterium]